ncbi:MAG: glycosyltransferase family 39 protein [Chloroflexi bacterium]|nr:glycosyltransferase family 39 protein [Chloroflexota bacterium]
MSLVPYLPTGKDSLELEELEQLYHEAEDAETRTYLQVVLLSQQGYSPNEIAQLTLLSEETVLNWLERYNRCQNKGIPVSSAKRGKIYLRVGLVSYFISLLITYYDSINFIFRGLVFGLWIIAIALCYYGLCQVDTRGEQVKFPIRKLSWREVSSLLANSRTHFQPDRLRKLPWRKIIPVVGVMVFTCFTSLLFLTSYPFNSIGDEMRDTGINGSQISRGEIKNIFAYGFGNAHGLIIPHFTSFFYRIFGNTLLTIRLPAALISIFDVLLLYLVIQKFFNKRAGWWAALILASLSLHLYYSRVELVVIFSSFWTTAILLALGYLLKNRSLKNFGRLGLILGFTLGFHASVRTFALLTLIIVAGIFLYYFWRKVKRTTLLNGFGLLLLLTLVGFGPRLLFSPPNIFFHTEALTEANQGSSASLLERVKYTIENYPKSLMVYIYEPVNVKSHNHQPVLPPPLAIFFVVGLVLALLPGGTQYKNPWITLVGLYALFLPFTNSAITNITNADYRLSPLWPIAAILTTYGLFEILARLRHLKIAPRLAYAGVAGITLLTIFYSTFWFFDSEIATYGMYRNMSEEKDGYQDYMVTYAIKTIQNNPLLKSQNSVCLIASPKNVGFLTLEQIKDQFDFFLPRTKVMIRKAGQEIADNQIYLANSCEQNLTTEDWIKLDYCGQPQKYSCPPGKKNFLIWVRPAASQTN